MSSALIAKGRFVIGHEGHSAPVVICHYFDGAFIVHELQCCSERHVTAARG